MKRFISFAVLLIVAVVLAGCSKEEYAVSPKYGKIFVSPAPAVGQQFSPEIEILEPGSGFYRGDYTISITKGTNSFFFKKFEVVSPLEKIPFKFTDKDFVINEPGTYTISCTVLLYASVQTESGGVFATPVVSSTNFTIK